MTADFYKYHALGNDYIVIDPNHTQLNLTPDHIKLICHRHFGIGSDGILYGPLFEQGRMRLRIFNPDGSEAEKSGNGIRIFSKYLVDARYATTDRISLDTLGGKVQVEILDKKANFLRVDMGSVTFRSDLIPVSGEPRDVVDEPLRLGSQSFNVTCLSIGNPHCVIPVQEISEELARQIGPLVENHPMFPNRINVQLLQVIGRNHIKIEIWERGAGYTLASGSSSCAAASAGHRLGLVDSKIKVEMPGGTMEIEIEPDGHVQMTGPVSSVARGEFSDELWEKLR